MLDIYLAQAKVKDYLLEVEKYRLIQIANQSWKIQYRQWLVRLGRRFKLHVPSKRYPTYPGI